jgi:drug/metabolite transporter (DMT)-like permease
VSRRAWLYFAVMCFLWGIPYLFIKVAVEELSPVLVVFARAAIGAAMLLPVALSSGALRSVRRHLGGIAVLATAEVIAPFLLISAGEVSIPSSLAGILVATVPLMVALLATWLDPSERITGWRLVGLVVGFGGVLLALGVDTVTGTALGGALMVLAATVGYAIGPLLIKRWFAALPGLGVTTAMLTISALTLLIPSVLLAPRTMPSAQAVAALLVLGIACTGLAFLVFFKLISLAGPGRATVITYVSPIVALLLGVGLRGEPITPSTVVGFALILAGSWVATGGRLRPRGR